MRARTNRQEWKRLITRFEDSGQSVGRFCEAHGLARKTFSWWRWRLRDERTPAPKTRATRRRQPTVRLLPVKVTLPTSGPEFMERNRTAPISITVGGVDVRVEVGTDATYVATLVSELRSRC